MTNLLKIKTKFHNFLRRNLKSNSMSAEANF